MTTDTKSELAAILTGAAIFPLDDRAFLRITGSDATRWLNGMVTNSIQALAPGEGNYNFLLNAQGRIQGDCMIYREPNPVFGEPSKAEPAFLLATNSLQLETIRDLLDKFIIMDDVELTPTPSNERTVVLLGPKAPELIDTYYDTFKFGRGVTHLAVNALAFLPDDVEQVATRPDGDRIAFECTGKNIDVLMRFAKEQGAVEVSPETFEAHRVLSGIPRFGVDIRDKDLPQETNQTHALHFSKGCYLGQEIVERIRSRGQVHRTFSGFRLTTLPAVLPAPLTSDGKPAGELTSAAILPLPEGDIPFALGYVRREALDRGQPLAYEGGSATPATLPLRMTTS